MLKKLSHIILTVLLFATTTGMIISKHYCGDTFVAFKLLGEAKSCCGDSDCCHNENHFFKVKDDFSATPTQNAPQLAEIDILVSIPGSVELPGEAENNNHIVLFTDSPPPPKIQKVLSLRQAYLL